MAAKHKRHFKRYRKASDFAVKLNNKYYRARLTDYSIDGLGLIIEDPPEIAEGDIIEVALEEPAIKAAEEVVWLSKAPAGLRIGLRNVGHLKGFLKDFGIADMLLGLKGSKKTGILSVENDGVERKVYFRGGDMVFSSSNHKNDSLADLLLRTGKISSGQFNDLRAQMERTALKEGALLIKLGYCKPKDLVPLVRQQIEEIILGLFALEGGRFMFREDRLPMDEIVVLKLPAVDLIYSGIKRFHGLREVSDGLSYPEGLPVVSPDLPDMYRGVSLDGAGRKIIACIDGNNTIDEIVSITKLDRSEVVGTMQALINIGMVELAGVRDPEEDPGERKPTKEKSRSAEETELISSIADMHGRYDVLGYYGVLGVRPHAPVSEIKSAYHKAAKMYHPDIHFSLDDDTIKGQLSDIFSYIYAAYTTLSDPEKRREYDESLAVKPARLTTGAEKARLRFVEGMIALKKGRYPDAEIFFGQATYFDGSVADYHYYYGLAMFKQKKSKPAEKAISRALRLEPSNAEFLAELGFVFMDLGLPVRAQGLFEKALKIAPANERAAEGAAAIRKM